MPAPMIAQYGWYLEKSGKDWKLKNAEGGTEILFIKITHPGGEVPHFCVKATQKALKEAKLE